MFSFQGDFKDQACNPEYFNTNHVISHSIFDHQSNIVLIILYRPLQGDK